MLNRRARAVLDTLLPSGAHPKLPLGIFDTGFDAFYEDFSRQALISMRFGFRLALWVAIWVAPLLIGRIPPISLHPSEVREQILAALAASRSNTLRQMMLILRVTCCYCYGAHDEVRRAVGYPEQFDRQKEPEVRWRARAG